MGRFVYFFSSIRQNTIIQMFFVEFEASIRIFFRDPEEDPVDINHMIKLYPPVRDSLKNGKNEETNKFLDSF